MSKLGILTIGQSPRIDVVPEIRNVLYRDIEIIEKGALDGLSLNEIKALEPSKDETLLVSRLNDGNFAKLSEEKILKRLQICIDELDSVGCNIILLLCTGKFPQVFHSKALLVYPQPIISSIVLNLAAKGKIGVVNPEEGQIENSRRLWSINGNEIYLQHASPYKKGQDFEGIGKYFREKDVDLIVLDCMGYNTHMKEIVEKYSTKPVVLPRLIISSIINQLL